jgi:hypothetical protein
VPRRRLTTIRSVDDRLRALVRLGWQVEGGGCRHVKVRPPDGVGLVVISGTASDWRAEKNQHALLTRAQAAYEGRSGAPEAA